jgi:ribose transport system substrate-binding protein
MSSIKRVSILLSLITRDNDYQLEQAALAESTAHKLNLDLKVIYADSDGVNQSLQLLKSIQVAAELRPDVIVAEPAGTAMTQVADAAARAGIGWVALNANVDYLGKLRSICTAPIFCVNTDNEEVGRLQGGQFNALMPGPGCVLYIEGPATSEAAQKRRKGMLQIKRKDLDVKTLKGDWTEAGAYQATHGWLRLPTSKDLHVGVVGSQNDAMALGARKAVEELGSAKEKEKLLKLPFTGCDGLPGKGQSYVQRGILTATVVTPPLTGFALEMLARALQSHIQPAEHTLIAPISFPTIDRLRASRPIACSATASIS